MDMKRMARGKALDDLLSVIAGAMGVDEKEIAGVEGEKCACGEKMKDGSCPMCGGEKTAEDEYEVEDAVPMAEEKPKPKGMKVSLMEIAAAKSPPKKKKKGMKDDEIYG